MSLAQEDRIEEYKPGSIRRIKLKNFLTYTNVEFSPGPRLNMVVGANGTGKSTILCAICLGLGGEPKLLGRADDAREFINHACQDSNAIVEIELAPQPGQEKHVFRRVIDRTKGSENGKGKGASTFFINGTKKSAKEVRRIVSDVYHISVENMCTFLPQDKVGSFSGFDAQSLLVETEKSLSANQHMYDHHLQLIEMEEDLRKGGNETDTIEAKLKALEAENERLEREKERMEEREQALEQMELLQAKTLWLQFDHARDLACRLRDERNQIKAQLKEAQAQLRPLQEKHASLVQKQERFKSKYQALDKQMKKSDREMEKHKSKAETHFDGIEETLSDLNSVDVQQRRAERQVEQQREKVEQAEEHLKRFPPEDDVHQALADAQQEMRSIKPDMTHARQEVSRLKSQFRDLEEQARRAHDKLQKTNDERTQRRNRIFRQQPKLLQVYQWIEENRKNFRRPVWGPILCEINPKTKNSAAFLEQHVPNATLKSFVVECREDNNFLYREVREKLDLPINIIEVNHGRLQPITRMYSEAKMNTLKQEHGVLGFMDESFSAPDAILEALRGQASVHKVLIGTERTQQSIDRKNLLENLTKKDGGESSGLQGCCIFTNHGDRSFKYTSVISRYSGKASTRVDDINPARLLAPGVNPAQKAAMEKNFKDAQQEIEDLKPEMQTAETQHNELTVKGQQITARLKQAKAHQAELQKFRRKLATAQQKLKDLEEAASSDNASEKKKLVKKLKNHIEGNITALEMRAESHSQMMKATHALAGVKISQDGIVAAARAAANLVTEKESEFADTTAKYDDVASNFEKAKKETRQTRERASREAPLMDENGDELPLKAQLEELPVGNLEEAEAALEEATARANSIDANPDVLRQYEARKKEIAETKNQLALASNSRETKLDEIEKIRVPWEAALRNNVDEVNKLFAQYMEELGCAGEISLSTGQDDDSTARRLEFTGNFKQWGIQIKVKFREKSSLQVLSAQVQSGGERSVSTIMYLMALQHLMVSPFRCVDEINQGLDERNERLVFKRIVANSTGPPETNNPTSHSGQYFLITPKLLPNLYDMESENMTVLFIFNGAHNFKHPKDWNVRQFIEIQKRLREGAAEEEGVADENSSAEANDAIPRKRRRRSVIEEEE